MSTILDLMVTLPRMRFATIARVTVKTWTACAVSDQGGFGLSAGNELPPDPTICNEVRQHRQAVVFGHARHDPEIKDHPTPKMYGVESYLSLPIIRSDGSFFGTL